MLGALKSEFRKLLTIRSTYFIAILALALIAFGSLYIEGYRNGPGDIVGPIAHLFLASSIVQHASILSLFGAVVGLLLVSHEYRYNMIMHSLTITNRRSKVLASKIIAVLAYVFVLVLIADAFGFLCMVLGLHLSGHSLPAQDINYLEYFAKTLVFCEGWAMTGTLLATLLRNQVAAFAVLFIVPNTVEGLLSLLLRDKTVYLPFSALSQVIAPPQLPGVVSRITENGSLSPLKGALIFLAYLTGGWVVAWILFLKRDAN